MKMLDENKIKNTILAICDIIIDERLSPSSVNTPSGGYSKATVWEACRTAHHASRGKGSRFANLEIVMNILPHGQTVEKINFLECGRVKSGEILPLSDILDSYASDS